MMKSNNITSAAAKERCELCGAVPRLYCESDEAMLCWGCDARVHGANFLVARHARTLLCSSCLGPTPWRAAGPRFGPTASLCERCCCRRPPQQQDEEEEEEEEDQEESEEEEGEGENQVVPWAEAEVTTPPPPVSSSSSSSSRSEEYSSLKRMEENAELASKNDHPCSTSQPSFIFQSARAVSEDEATSSGNGVEFLPASRCRKRFHAQPLASPGRIQTMNHPSNSAILQSPN